VADCTDWAGSVAGRIDPTSCLGIKLVFPDIGPGGSNAVPVRATDDQRWWLKPTNNPQGPRVTINEYVVGQIGELIGAPTCKVAIVEIDSLNAGPRQAPAPPLEVGFACGSFEVPGSRERRTNLEFRSRDDNSSRHVGIIALWDLCFGADPQWLYQSTDDERTWSHDHGLFFPQGPNWTEQSLVDHLVEVHQLAVDTTDLDKPTIERVATKIDELQRNMIETILSSVPASWPVTDSELECLGWFIHERTGPVAERLRSLV